MILVLIGGLFGAGLWAGVAATGLGSIAARASGRLLGFVSEDRATQVARWRLATTAISLMIIALGVAAIVRA